MLLRFSSRTSNENASLINMNEDYGVIVIISFATCAAYPARDTCRRVHANKEKRGPLLWYVEERSVLCEEQKTRKPTTCDLFGYRRPGRFCGFNQFPFPPVLHAPAMELVSFSLFPERSLSLWPRSFPLQLGSIENNDSPRPCDNGTTLLSRLMASGINTSSDTTAHTSCCIISDACDADWKQLEEKYNAVSSDWLAVRTLNKFYLFLWLDLYRSFEKNGF